MSGRVRRDFAEAARGFAAVVAAVPPQSWDRPGLGVWTVRDLTGHTSRALLTVESYLRADVETQPDLPDAIAYYRAAAVQLADPDEVAERGRRAGAALGEDPAAAVEAIAARVLPLAAAAPDGAGVATPVGSMRLVDYLPARTFELVVHSLDLVRAVDGTVPAGLAAPVASCARLAVDLAAASGRSDAVLEALTGRTPLAPGFTVV